MILALIASGLTLIFGIMDVSTSPTASCSCSAPTWAWRAGGDRQLLAGARPRDADRGADRRRAADHDPAPADRPRSLTTILATFGISLVMQNYALWQFGPVARKIHEPFTGHFTLFYLEYPWYRLVIAALSAAIIGGFWLFLKYGTYGIWIRATTQDRVMAEAMGIPVAWVHTAVFAIGAAGAGRERRAVWPAGRRQPRHGSRLGAQGVHRGGGRRHGQSRGSIAASIFVSLLEAYASIWVSPAQAVIVSFVVLILTLLFRPTGLFVPTPK